MSKQIEKLKKQLTEIAEVVNSFQSEAVQVKVVERLLNEIIENERTDTEGIDLQKRTHRFSGDIHSTHENIITANKKPGATKILNQLLTGDFFKTPHSISGIADYCKDQYDSNFKTSELSGILLKLAKENKLKRLKSQENNRFEYVGAS